MFPKTDEIPQRRCRHAMTPRCGPPHAVTAPACWAPMTLTLFRHAMTAFHHVGASFHGAPTNISALAVEKIPRRRCRHGMTKRAQGARRRAVTGCGQSGHGAGMRDRRTISSNTVQMEYRLRVDYAHQPLQNRCECSPSCR
jgi:hypothetical protein